MFRPLLLFLAIVFADGIEEISPIKIAALQGGDQHLCRGNVGGHGDIIAVTGEQKLLLLALDGCVGTGVTEAKQDIDLVIRDARCDLLLAPLLSGQEPFDF